MEVRIEESWKRGLADTFASPQFAALSAFVHDEYRNRTVYPPAKLIFRALDLCPVDRAKVVVVGQDPYHGAGQANGLCFSVDPGTDAPPSLANIFQELESDLGRPPHAGRDLEHWARQGVLLLNATLTVRAGEPTSHAGRGWEAFTDAALAHLAKSRPHLVFILWGAYAQKKGAFIDRQRHCVIASPHPSPLSAYRGFFGSKPFSRANAQLGAWGMEPIDW